MNKIPTILLFLGLLLLMACNDPKHVTDTLHRAETLMNEHPDSAWAMLNTLSPDEMGQIVPVPITRCSTLRRRTRTISTRRTTR